MNKLPRTQWFSVRRKPQREGRFLALPEGMDKPVYRYWNGKEWQYNRRKKALSPNFGKRPGDKWAGTPKKAGL